MEMSGRAQSPIGMAIDAVLRMSARKCNAALAAGKFNADVDVNEAGSSWRSKRIVNFSPWRYTRACDGIAA
jgi:hypothetical protein